VSSAASGGGGASGPNEDMKLEVVVIPVSDVDRARDFYVSLGWRLDATPPGVVQLTPPGSACSVQFGGALTTAEPGSAQHNYLVVEDIEATRDRLVAAGAEVGELFHISPDGPVPGLDPERRSYFSRAEFSDPDGNTWWLQELTTRLPGRIDPDAGTTYASIADLRSALVRAATAHGEHEKRAGGEYDEDWPSWYAEYMVKEQSGEELPT
jgi:catechol 2,3-dioxygenase-like lactoylglutathione lyase family enzyme